MSADDYREEREVSSDIRDYIVGLVAGRYSLEVRAKMEVNAREFIDRQKWQGLVLLCEDQDRPELLYWIRDELGGPEYWDLVRTVWEKNDFPNQHRWEWAELFTDTRPGRESMMNAEERARLESLPEPVHIYRGYIPRRRNLRGQSWTLDQQKAEWFARRYAIIPGHGRGRVAHGVTPWANVLAFLNDRHEQEVLVVDPQAVRIRSKSWIGPATSNGGK